jgi:acetyl-CoA carboxylase carboxyl transferase subunit beta
MSQERQERDMLMAYGICPACGVLAYTKDLMVNQMVCQDCGHHMRVDSNERIRQLIDANTWKP